MKRLALLVLIFSLALTALTLIGVALSRGDDYQCVLLYDGYTVAPETYILDTTRGLLAQDRREVQRLYSAAAPDGRRRASFVERFGEHATMTLQIEDGETTRVVLTGVDGSSVSDGFRQVGWSRDGNTVAVMWRDGVRRRYLTTIGADGVIRQSIPYTRTVTSHPTLDPVIIAGWSGDDRYVVTAEYAAQSYNYHFFHADTLTRQPTAIDGVPLLDAEIAPVGDEIAAISVNQLGTPELLIASISGAHDVIRVPLPTSGLSWGVSWSPSGEFLSIERTVGCQDSSCASAGWHFDLYRRDGTQEPEWVGLQGTGLHANPSLILPAMWEGDQWVWVARAADPIRFDLMALNMRTGEREIVQRDLVPEFVDDLFYVPPEAERQSIFTNQPLFPMSRDSRLIVPYRAGDGIAVDLIDAATGERQTLARGIDRLMGTHYGVGSDFWSDDGAAVWVSWEQGGDQAYIRVAHLRAGTQVTSGDGLRAVWRPQWIDATHIGFIDPGRDGNILYVLNTVTGDQTRIMPVERSATFWQAALSADGYALAATGGNSALTGKPLALLDVRDGSSQVVSETGAGTFVWSPDGAHFAFAEQVDRRTNIAVSDRTGADIRRYYLPEIAGTPLVQFIKWTRC